MNGAETEHPIEIDESLRRFREDHPDPTKTAFIMMKFGTTGAHKKIVQGIRTTLQPFGISALRADEFQYHDDLFPNILTYVYGCGLGLAVFERIEADDFNPNVSLEVGYMFALRKPVCLLKDQTLRTLHSNLVGKLYRLFDPENPAGTIGVVLEKWLREKGIVEDPTAAPPKETQHPLLFSGASDVSSWSLKSFDTFFTNLEHDAQDRARREWENIDVGEEAISDRAQDLIKKQVLSYDVKAEYEKWKKKRRR